MGERCEFTPGTPSQINNVRPWPEVRRLAERQWGRVSFRQLKTMGLGNGTITTWRTNGLLHWVRPGVYAVGHCAPTVEGDLVAALLYAGPGAMLSDETAAWWRGLAQNRPGTIEVSTPRQCRSLSDVRVRSRRQCERDWHRGLPVTSIAQTLIDLATSASLDSLRRLLAEAEYARALDLPKLEEMLGRGRPGSARLRAALKEHQPRLARTRSELERRFLRLCEKARIPLPEINAKVLGMTVDALWREERVIVELDGHRAHGSPARIETDRKRELRLRGAGFLVVRYTWRQIVEEPDAVIADLRANLRLARPADARRSRQPRPRPPG